MTDPKFTIAYSTGEGKELILHLSGVLTWPELQDQFNDFLRGIGYIIPYTDCEEDA